MYRLKRYLGNKTDKGVFAMTVKEIIEVKIEKKIKEKKGEVDGIVVLDISGPDGGVWTIDCTNAIIKEEDTASPLVRIKMSDSDFVDMIDGKLNAISATFSGKLKIEGDMAAATKLAQIIR